MERWGVEGGDSTIEEWREASHKGPGWTVILGGWKGVYPFGSHLGWGGAVVSIANSPLHFHALVNVLMRNMANPVHSKYTLSQFVRVEAQERHRPGLYV